MYATFAGVYPESRAVATESEREARRAVLEPLEKSRKELRKTFKNIVIFLNLVQDLLLQ